MGEDPGLSKISRGEAFRMGSQQPLGAHLVNSFLQRLSLLKKLLTKSTYEVYYEPNQDMIFDDDYSRKEKWKKENRKNGPAYEIDQKVPEGMIDSTQPDL